MPETPVDGLRVLVVEDNVHMRALLRSVMHALGVRVLLEAEDGERAYELYKHDGADIILTDLSMARLDGIGLTQRIRNDPNSPNPYVPIIMVTGHTERHRVEAARDAGVTEFLAKPVTVQKLLLRMQEVVERPRAYIRCDHYFGPDRRRRFFDDYSGPKRRHEDGNEGIAP